MAVRGYLAGIFRSIGTAVGGQELHQLLTNPDFETGDTSGWTGTATVTRPGRYGRGYYAAIAAGNSLSQTVTLDSTLTQGQDTVVSCWAKPAGQGCTLKAEFLDASSQTLSTKTLTMSTDPKYQVNGWSLYSMRVSAPQQTKSVRYTVEAAATVGVDIDDCALVFVNQVAGAMEELSGAIRVDTQDVTTFKSAQETGGWRTHIATLRGGEEISIRSYYLTEDAPATTLEEESLVFVQLYSDVSANERWEFWARVTGLTGRFPLDGPRENEMTLMVTGDVGFTNTTAD